MKAKYDLVVFDLDGTLLNTIEDLATAVNYSLSQRQMPIHPVEDYPAMVGHGISNLVKNAFPEHLRGDSDLMQGALADFREYYSAHIDVYTKPYPHIPELLEELQECGCMMAVASNKFQAGTEHLVKKIFPDINFVTILGNSPDNPLKPDPMIVQHILKMAGRSADENKGVVMIGDSQTDILTGLNAGISTIAVTWGYRNEACLSKADLIVHSVEELRMALR